MPSTDSMQSAPTAASREASPPLKEGKNADAEANYNPKSLKFWTIIIGMLMSIFLVALDRIIIATAIPSITDEFHSIDDIGWYGSAYMLTAAIFNLLFGRIYKLYSLKWTFLASIVIFEAGSALCGAAPTSAAFIVGRAIAGIGAAGVFSGGILMTVDLIPLHKRPVFVSFYGMAFGVSSVLGPLIGGSFTDNIKLTWRWCFYINLPIGAFTIVAILLFLHPESKPREKLSVLDRVKSLDPLGLLFFAPSMVCLILALQWGGTTDPWSAPRIIGLLVTFAVLFIAFMAVEALTPETAMAPTRVVLNRSVAGSMLFTFLVSGAMITVIYYLSIWFQAAQGQSAMESGIRTIPLVLSLVLFGIVSAVITQKIGYYVPALLLSPILCAVGGGLLSTLTPDASSSRWIGYQVLYGLGIGCGFQTANLAPQNVLPRADIPLGMGLMFFMQQLGGAVFTSVGQNIFSNQLVDRLSGISDLDAAAVVGAGATGFRAIVSREQLGAVVDAFSHSLTRVFILTAALSACMILGTAAIEWKSIKVQKTDAEKKLEAGGAQEAGPKSEKLGGGEQEVSQKQG